MHVVRPARSRYELALELFKIRGTLAAAELGVSSQVAKNMNKVRDAARFPESAVSAGELFAAGIIDEVLRAMVTVYAERNEPQLLGKALDHLGEQLGTGEIDGLLADFTDSFPPLAVIEEAMSALQYLDAATEDTPHRQITLEELLMLRLGNENPANVRFRELFDDAPLEVRESYERAVQALEAFFEGLEPMEGGTGGPVSLLALLRAPAEASPTSLEGQLRFIREHWSGLLGDRFPGLLERILRATDVLVEERKEGGLGFGPPPVLDAWALGGGSEYERFSEDSSWMPRVVLLAKSTYVWLHQLSRDYGREIVRLDQVPDEELDRIAAAGFTGLWLIGLWERSTASRTIKHMRGDPDAVASAYALYDYVIAHDLGGEAAYENLRNRAWDRGVRLASDMVPNHVGIDGRWVIEHPDWFLSLDDPPYPGYTFTGADLCQDDRVTVQIEDHYWDGTDAAVVFKRYDHQTGQTRYIYHGNDGTAMPWNDTAQLNYLDPVVREGVIQTILHVARKFPIIRFDAAMTLAKRHIRRLWFPAPGEGGAIPSRSMHGLSDADFEAAIPEEFWREVVDRVAAEVPDTLLLAEAFWMMEGYFVRTLGMHRVYNSAFMHMLAKETNGEYRQLMKNVLDFDPEIMKRFVNFMNNPDEETAIAQFGKEGKYFGVATVMATLPGLPMFGHGQLEGYSEKYGMEFRRPRWDEYPDEWLVDRHRREIFPLLHRRWQFAEVAGFLLYDVVAPEGHTIEDVFAYSNNVDGNASLVLFHNTWGDAVGHIHVSVPYRDKGAGEMRTRTIGEGLGLRGGEDDWLVFREHVSGLEYMRRSREIVERGLALRLGAFEYRVYVDFREVAGPEYDEVARRLGGGGTPSIEAELETLRLEPVRSAAASVIAAATSDADDLEAAVDALVDVAASHGIRVDLDGEALDAAVRRGAITDGLDEEIASRLADPRWLQACVAAAHVAEALGEVVGDGVASGFRASALVAPEPGLLEVASRPFDEKPEDAKRLPHVRESVRLLLETWDADGAVRSALGVNLHDDVEWFDRDRFRRLVSAMAAMGLSRTRTKRARDRLLRFISALAHAEDDTNYRWEDLTS